MVGTTVELGMTIQFLSLLTRRIRSDSGSPLWRIMR